MSCFPKFLFHFDFDSSLIAGFFINLLKGSGEGRPITQPGQSEFNGQRPFYSFLPPAPPQIGQATTSTNNCTGEVGESIDLDLKL
jgi:hypothetical protein